MHTDVQFKVYQTSLSGNVFFNRREFHDGGGGGDMGKTNELREETECRALAWDNTQITEEGISNINCSIVSLAEK